MSGPIRGIRNAGPSCNHIDRMLPQLHHLLCGLYPELFHGLRRRLPGLDPEGAAELARAEIHSRGDLLNRKLGLKVAPGVGECTLDSVEFWIQLQHC